MSVVHQPSASALHEQLPGISYIAVFGFLTGLLQLFAFCFLPWLATSVDCGSGVGPGPRCDGAAQLQPMNPTGLTLAAGSVTTHEVVARIQFLSDNDYQFHMWNVPLPALPESHLSVPFLWIFPLISLLILIFSGINLLSRGAKGPQGSVKNVLLGGALLLTMVSALIYAGIIASAFPEISNALAQLSIKAPDGTINTLNLFILPSIGFWITFLVTLMGSMFIFWAWWEERSENLMYTVWHLESVTRLWRAMRRDYRLYPINVTWPQRGVSKTTFVCPSCHQSLTLRVRSKRRTWLYRSILAAGLSALWLLATINTPFAVYTMITEAIFSLIFIFPMLILLDGISLGRFLNRSHFIRRGERGRNRK